MAPADPAPHRPRARHGSGAEMSFGEHLDELRRRLIHAIVGIVPIFALGLFLGRDILDFLIEPAQRQLVAMGQPPFLQATGPAEVFATWIRVSVIFTVLVASPWILFQLWLFIAPGLYAHERRFVYLLIPFSALLTVASAVFLYYVMLPIILAFLIGFGSTVGAPTVATAPLPDGVALSTITILDHDPPDPAPGEEWVNTSLNQRRVCVGRDGERPIILGTPLSRDTGIVQQYRIVEYVGLMLAMALGFAGGFQTPVVVLLLGWVGLVRRETLVRQRKYAVLIITVVAAILTPTGDPVTLVLLAGPLYLLFEFGVFLLRYIPARRVIAGFRREPMDAGDE